jgi:two-component system phosphate regulon sensor histidine kinase PhoR
MRRDRTVGGLLARNFSVLVALIVCSGLAELTAVFVQHRVVRELSTHVQPLELANADLRGVLGDAQRGLRGYALTGDSQLLDTYHTARIDYFHAGQRIRGIVNKTEAASVEEQLRRADVWWTLAERQRQAPPRSDEASRYVAEGKVLFEQFLLANRQLDADLAARAATLQKRSARLGGVTLVVLVVLTVGAAATVGITAYASARRITRPLGAVVGVLSRRGAGEFGVRADAGAGPAEIRAVAAAVNTMADEGDRLRDEERYIARMRGAVRELGNRIRSHLNVADATTEAIQGLAVAMQAEHVLVRMAGEHRDEPWLASLRDEHTVRLAALAACDWGWLRTGGWTTGDPAPPGGARPPEPEQLALSAAGGGPALTVAVSGGDECLGALTLIRDAGPSFTPADVRLVEMVAADLGRAVHHARLFEREQHLVARLQELDTAKTDFMSTVSHELRTPLTSINGYVELLLDDEAGELNPAQTRMVDVIGRNSRRLRDLIEEMLLLSKIESGGYQTTRQPVELTSLVDQAVAAMAPAAAKAQVAVRAEVYGEPWLDGDPDQLDRVVMNLLANAVKFTPPEGTVTVLGRRQGDEVLLVVADTGMGIPAREQKALFTRFFRASNAVRRAVPGTGLGLAIVSTVVEHHGGRIEVQSTEGVGTTFTVWLPAAGSSQG